MSTCQYCGADVEPYIYGQSVYDHSNIPRCYLQTVDYEAGHLDHVSECLNHPMHANTPRRNS